mmetsp:Transcript_17475/g.27379  ORF Transcript_17475/g.27379 Transcript_17475/m.27379 type:complete len:88 (-) Transcript_17475:644-907(-)
MVFCGETDGVYDCSTEHANANANNTTFGNGWSSSESYDWSSHDWHRDGCHCPRLCWNSAVTTNEPQTQAVVDEVVVPAVSNGEQTRW